MECTVKIQLLNHLARLPEKAHDTDACFDVEAVSKRLTNGGMEYGLGFATEIPEGWQGLIYPRSSIRDTDLGLRNSVGVVDAGYRGEWKVCFALGVNCRDSPCFSTYNIGDRVAQIQFQRVPTVAFEVVDSLPDTQRGAGGFGSTAV